MTKKEARKKYRQLRRELTDEQISVASKKICEQLISLTLPFQTVHVFYSIKRLNELNLNDFIEDCYAKNKLVCTSVSNFKTNEMITKQVTAQTVFKENEWGIPEPVLGKKIQESQIDLVIVPLLYADKNGNRVGYGKGFYDRFLSKCRNDVYKIGVNYFKAQEEISDAEETDVRIDKLLFISN